MITYSVCTPQGMDGLFINGSDGPPVSFALNLLKAQRVTSPASLETVKCFQREVTLTAVSLERLLRIQQSLQYQSVRRSSI